MEPSENPVANPVVVLREEFDDWAVLFNPDTAKAFGINPIGVEIWKLMDGKHSVAAITEGIKAHFDDVSGTVTDEIKSFIGDLSTNGFLGYEIESNTR
jgi:SynChlorMet cassette protein ScmD